MKSQSRKKNSARTPGGTASARGMRAVVAPFRGTHVSLASERSRTDANIATTIVKVRKSSSKPGAGKTAAITSVETVTQISTRQRMIRKGPGFPKRISGERRTRRASDR